MTSYIDPWPPIFLLFSINFVLLIEIIRAALGRKGPTWRLIGHIIGFWLGSYALFFIFDFLTYRGGTIYIIWMQETINAIIILSILGSIWYEMTAETRWKPLIPITLLITGTLSAGYGFITLPISPFSDPGGILLYIQKSTIFIGFGIILIIIGLFLQLYWWKSKS